MSTAMIEEATIGTLHLAHGSVVAGYTATLSGSNTDWNTNAEIARFSVNMPEAYRGLVVFECTGITRHNWDSPAVVVLQMNGASMRRSQSLVLASPMAAGINYTHNEERAVAVVPVNLPAGTTVFRLRGRNTSAVSYLLDILAFKR